LLSKRKTQEAYVPMSDPQSSESNCSDFSLLQHKHVANEAD